MDNYIYQYTHNNAGMIYQIELDRSNNLYEVRVNGKRVAVHKRRMIGYVSYYSILFEIENIQCAFILTNCHKVPRLMIDGIYVNTDMPYGGLPQPIPPFFWIMAIFSALVVIGIVIRRNWIMLFSPILGVILARYFISAPPVTNKEREPQKHLWNCIGRWYVTILIWAFYTLIPFLLLMRK